MRFLLFFIFLNILGAQKLEANETLAPRLNLQCLGLKTNLCDAKNLPAPILLATDLCKTTIASEKCTQLAKDDPDLQRKIKKCTPDQLCSDVLFKEIFSLKGCFSGYVDGAISQLIEFKNIIVEAHKNKEIFLKSCNVSIECKRSLIKDHPHYVNLSDADLDKYSAAFLETQGINATNNKKAFERNSQQSQFLSERAAKMEEVEKLREKTSIPEVQLNERMRDLGLQKAAEEWLEKQGAKLDCFNSEAKAEMICWGAAQILDPIMAVKMLKSTPKLFNLIKKSGFKDRRIGSQVPHNSSIERGYLKDMLLHAEYTSEAENLKWIQMAKAGQTKNRRFIEIENSKLKELNDSLKDKDLVTAMTNMHKQLTMEEFQKLSERFPNLKFSPYSDFKSVRFAIDGKIPPGFDEELQIAFSNIQNKFSSWSSINKLVREGDQTHSWFKMGFGDHADEASAAARFARNQTKNSQVVAFKDPEVIKSLTEKLQSTEKMRSGLEKDLQGSKLLTLTPQGVQTLDTEAFEILRKSSNSTEAAEKLKTRFGLSNLPNETAQKMLEYARSVDQFSPSLHVAKREVASLDTADMGGFSIDFVGMGANNLGGTASALAGRTDINLVLKEARKAEQEVTQMFQKQRDQVKDITQGSLGRKLETICSGDDCVGIVKSPLTKEEKQRMLENYSKSGDGSRIRISFIRDGIVNQEARTQIATHGESIEKYLRTNLEGKIEPKKLRGVLFAVDMNAIDVGKGPVSLLTSTAQNVKLTSDEVKKIQKAFKEAVSELNGNLKEMRGYKAE